MNVQRWDFVRSRIKKLDKHLDENGFAILEATPTRVGVLKYEDSNGNIVRELRHPDQVFDSESIKTLSLKPFTLEHRGGFVKPESSEEQVKGAIGENITVEGDYLKCKIAIYSKEAMDSIEDEEMLELSAGYTCKTVKESGVYGGEPYDFRQLEIRYNHVTATTEGRAGSSCCLRLDAKGSAYIDYNKTTNEVKMKIKVGAYEKSGLKIDSMEVEENEDTLAMKKALDMCMKKIDTLISEKDKKSDSIASDLVKMDSFKLRIDSLEKENASLRDSGKNSIQKEKLDSLMKRREEILNSAKIIEYKMPDSGSFEEINKKATREILALAGYDKEKFDSIQGYEDAAWDIYHKDSEKINGNINSLRNLETYKLNDSEGDPNVDYSSKPL